ncbi:MAG: pilus assembly protein PilM [Chitinispirillaceae bacterium]|nr:pilus assembly protein PilM [Chitinispirillaceae bacterium]
MSKTTTSIGIDFDARGVRMVKVKEVRAGKSVRPSIDCMYEASGDFSNQAALVGALKDLVAKVKPRDSDRVVTSASGRQVYITQMRFKAQPEADMKKALRAEIRKNLTFEMAGATLDYQVMDKGDEKNDAPLITVTAVAKSLIEQQRGFLSKAGLMPAILDVLPAAVANACWIGAPADDGTRNMAHVVVHLAPDLCTVVIDGEGIPFYARSIYFAVDRFFGPPAPDTGAQEKSIQLETLAEELRRSLAYYSTTNGISEFTGLCPIGNYVEDAGVRQFLQEKTGLEVRESTLLSRMGCARPETPGKYDVAISLAVHGLEN